MAKTNGKATPKATNTPKAQPQANAKPEQAQPVKRCLCGCGGETKGRFVPGHDARVKGLLRRLDLGKAKEGDKVSTETLAYAKANPTGRVVADYLGKDVVQLAALAKADPKPESQSEVK